MSAADNAIFVDTTSSAVTLTLPAPTNGRVLQVKDSKGNAATNSITINPHASETIDGGSSFVLNQNYESVNLISDGTNWFVNKPAMAGAVTSVALALPSSVFNVSGSPVTSSGTLTGTFANQSANQVFAGPTTGSATTPAFRALVANDIPATLNSTTFSGQVIAPAGSASTPGFSFTGNGNMGMYDASGFLHLATAGVSAVAIDLSQNVTIAGTVSASNLSGTNSGDVTLSSFGSSPNANGASLSGQALTLQPADATHPGGVSTASQTFAGDKTFSGNTLIAQATASQATMGVVGSSAQHQINGGLVVTTNTVSTNYTII